MAVLRDAMMKCEMMHKILPHCPSIFPMVAMMGGIIPCSSAAAVMMTMNYRMQSSSNNCIGAYLYLNPLVWPGGPPLRPCQGKGQGQSTSTSARQNIRPPSQPTAHAQGQGAKFRSFWNIRACKEVKLSFSFQGTICPFSDFFQKTHDFGAIISLSFDALNMLF